MKHHVISDCCNAPVINGHICSECREVCVAVDQVNEDPSDHDFEMMGDWRYRPLTPMENWQTNYRHNVG